MVNDDTQPIPKPTALEQFLLGHRLGCTVHVYSGDRHCSCGRDKAREEYRALQAELRQLRRMTKIQSDQLAHLRALIAQAQGKAAHVVDQLDTAHSQ